MMRRLTALTLVVFMSSPGSFVFAAPSMGTIRGTVTVGARPLMGVELAFIEVASGAIVRARTAKDGNFTAEVPPGRYVVTAESQAGLVVDKAPTTLMVNAGQVVSASVALAAVPSAVPLDAPPPPPPAPAAVPPPTTTTVPAAPEQPPAAQAPPPPPPAASEAVPEVQQPGIQPPAPDAPVTATTILHEDIGCMIAGQFPLVDARIEPAASVARARVYFKAIGSEAWYYVEMVPAEGGFVGKLPRPKLEASPVTYYIQAMTTEFGEAQTHEVSALVVEEATDCDEDKKIAPIGPPGEVTVFSAATGSAIAPAGFAAGGLLATGLTALIIIGGAAAAGLVAAITVNNPSPTPPPSTPPPPTPTPTPTPPGPAPTPTPTPGPGPAPTPVTP